MAIERRFRFIPPQVFTSNGTTGGEIQIANTKVFKVEQIVLLKGTGLDTLKVQIKDIISETTLYVGPIGRNLSFRQDISSYIVALGSTIEAEDQTRPIVSDTGVQRATYEEPPAMARRTIQVDQLGDPYNEDNPFPVEATVVQGRAKNQIIYRINYTTANIEVSQLLPNSVKKIYVAAVDGTPKMRLSFVSNGTNSNNFITVKRGNFYMREGLGLEGKTLYFQTDRDSLTVEIEVWI